MSVDCTGKSNCFDSGAGYGNLSTSTANYQPAFDTRVGWDFASGLGTVNVFNLVSNWPAASANRDFSLFVSPGSVTVSQGSSGGAPITFTPINGFRGTLTLSACGFPSGVTPLIEPVRA